MKERVRSIKESLQDFCREEEGVGVVEVMLILAVLVFLVAIFKEQVVETVQSAAERFKDDAQNASDY